ncbi:MAG: transporter [Deltaproteobacteria bacterium CG11_big_fil_rev_8_21_14_0_20_45_16]|nr:MAG: transporter [Deltaproteobacteria bacterium CG11_big_fil_rev_8_21_14_0_20_45_16]
MVEQINETAQQSLIGYFFAGGVFMWVILAISFVAMAIGLERYFALRHRFSIDGRRLFNEVKKYITANDWRRALETCRQYAHKPLAQVLGAGLSHADQPVEEIETAMESQTLYYVPRINDRLSYLSTLANIATLVGLLGTISGLIAAFSAVGGVIDAGISKEEALAQGIGIAMYTTAFGLIVAIPSLLAHMYLSNKANQIIDDIDHYATSLKQLIQRVKAKGQVPQVALDFSTDSKVSQKSESRVGAPATDTGTN